MFLVAGALFLPQALIRVRVKIRQLMLVSFSLRP
jgi:hypothetical protein